MTNETEDNTERSSPGEPRPSRRESELNPIADSDEGEPSRDQLAIEAYLSSDSFARGKVIRGEQPRGRTSAPIWDWLMEGLLPTNQGLSPIGSFWFGVLGLNVMLIVFSTFFPITVHLLENYINNNETYVFVMIVMQSITFPALIAFSFATVTPMFWYGSVLLRFATGVIGVIPGIAAFTVTLALIEEVGFDDDFFLSFVMVMFSQFVAAGVVAVTIQMWSPWTLTHARNPETAIPAPGTRALIDLTGIAAFGFSIAVVTELNDFVVGMLIFGAFGLLSSLGVIAAFIAFLNRGRRSMIGGVIAFAFAFATAFLLCGFFAYEMFGWESIWYNGLLVSAVALYGTAVVCCVMWLCIAWLRGCGWSCVRRDEERARMQRWQQSQSQIRPTVAD